jgi:hypothetical protein
VIAENQTSPRAPGQAAATADAVRSRGQTADPDRWAGGAQVAAGRPDPLDLDLVTGEVLRRIERRALAQRERLGRAAF